MKTFSKTIVGILLVFLAWNPSLRAEDTQPAPFSLGGIEFLGNQSSYLGLGAGAFDFSDDPSAAGYIEYRHGKKLLFIGPVAGIMANTDGGVFGYGGVYADLKYRNLIITPLITLGGYHQGGSKDLGGTFQFRTGINIAYEFSDGSRLGARLAHISNASIHDRNPGENEIFLTYTLPLTF